MLKKHFRKQTAALLHGRGRHHHKTLPGFTESTDSQADMTLHGPLEPWAEEETDFCFWCGGT